MKPILCLLLALTAALSCSGCGWMEGSYVSVQPHQVGYSWEEQDESVVSGYSELRSAVTGLIDAGTEEAVLTLSDYPEEEACKDMDAVISYAKSIYPVGAYAVSEIQYEYGQNLLSVEITYRRSKAQIDRIRTVRGIDGAKDAIARSLANFDDSLVLQITGFTEMDVVQYVADYASAHPDVVMELPQVTAQIYPQQGTVRILELQFTYQTSRDSLRAMYTQVRQVFSSARLYVTADADDGVKLNQLYGFLMERFDYTIQTSITPGYSLLCYGVGDSRAFAQVYAAMCAQAGLEAMTVSGTFGGESRFWNIVRDGDTYYHVDLLECARRGSYQELSDEEMTEYVWDYSAYPVCGVPQEGQTEPTETTAPVETGPSESAE